MLAHLLSLPLLFAPPAAETPPRTDTEPAGEFGELEAEPESASPTSAGSDASAAPTNPEDAGGASGYGALAPLPNYGDAGPEEFGELEVDKQPELESWRASKRGDGFEEPKDYGPFFEPEPVTEVRFPGDINRPDRNKPFASIAGGVFCFVEDSVCGSSLIADADVGVGINMINSDRGLDVPYTQFRVRWGVTVRPLRLAKKRWHPWGVGVVGSWSLGSGSVAATSRDATDALTDVTETPPITSWRVALLNQIWLGQKRNALHLDFTLGGVNSTVLDAPGRYWGTHAEAALGFGGWGGLYLAGDFLDQDLRVFMGVRGHGIATAPLIALVVLGLVAGGVAL